MQPSEPSSYQFSSPLHLSFLLYLCLPGKTFSIKGVSPPSTTNRGSPWDRIGIVFQPSKGEWCCRCLPRVPGPAPSIASRSTKQPQWCRPVPQGQPPWRTSRLPHVQAVASSRPVFWSLWAQHLGTAPSAPLWRWRHPANGSPAGLLLITPRAQNQFRVFLSLARLPGVTSARGVLNSDQFKLQWL